MYILKCQDFRIFITLILTSLPTFRPMQAREAVLRCREEVTRRKRMTAEERTALNAETAAAEAAHRRLRAHLAAWRHEAEERYETMAAKLEVDSRIDIAPASTPTSPPPDTGQGYPTSPAPRP